MTADLAGLELPALETPRKDPHQKAQGQARYSEGLKLDATDKGMPTIQPPLKELRNSQRSGLELPAVKPPRGDP